MKHLKVLVLATMALCALAATMASAALALPDVSVTLGGTYPLENLASSTTVGTTLSSAAGAQLTGTGLLVQLITSALGALGKFDALFNKVKNKEGNECSSAGDVAGTVLTEGEFHIVPIKLSPLESGILFLVKEVTITCGTQKIKVKEGSDTVSTLTAAEHEITTASGELTGNKKGVPTIKAFFNDEGKEVATSLLSNFGTGFVSTAEEVAEPVKFTAQGSKMYEITGR